MPPECGNTLRANAISDWGQKGQVYFSMKTRKLKSGNWNTQVYLGKDSSGKMIFKSFTGPDKRTVERQAAAFSDEHREHAKRMSVGTALDTFISTQEAVLSPSTVRGYKSLQKCLERKYSRFCASDIYSVTEQDMQALVNQMMPGHTTKTVRNYIGLVIKVMNFYRVSVPKVIIPRQIQEEEFFPDNDTIKKVCALAADDLDLLIPIELSAFAMMRRSEICALKYPDDFAGNTAHIYKALVKDADGIWLVKPPKTKTSRRFVPVPDFVMDHIKQYGMITRYNPDYITHKFGRMLRREGIPPFRYHSLRAYSASAALDAGCSVQVVETLGGWEHGSAVLQKAYVHTLNHAKRHQSEMLNSYFEKMLE